MKAKSQVIAPQKSEHESMFLRITPDASRAVIGNYMTAFLLVDLASNFQRSIPIMSKNTGCEFDYPSTLCDISPDGRYLALSHACDWVSGHDGMLVYVYDTETKQYLPPFIHQSMKYKSYANIGVDGRVGYSYVDIRFLADSKRLITATVSGEIFVWDIEQQGLLWVISATAHYAVSVALTRKFSLFAMSENISNDWHSAAIGRYMTKNGQVFEEKFIRQEPLLWLPTGKLNTGNFLRLWNIYSGTLIRQFEADDVVQDLVFSLDDKLLAGQMQGRIVIWDVETGAVLDALPRETQPIAFTADSRFLVTQIGTDKIGLWDVAAKNWHRDFTLEGGISAAQLSANDKLIALSKTGSEWLLHEVKL